MIILIAGVDCYIKLPFEVVNKGQSSYGNGSVTDGLYKVPVNISHYEHQSNLTAGTHVKINGRIQFNSCEFIFVILIKSMYIFFLNTRL